MKRIFLMAIAAGSLALIACNKPASDKEGESPAQTNTTGASAKADDPHAAAATNAATAAAAMPTPAPADLLADSELVTAADMEEEAETAITAKNYKTEITSLEAEISKE